MRGIVQRVFQEHYHAHCREHGVSEREARAARALMTCRTAAQGYHLWSCPSGDYELKQLNSCKHRSCPLCGATETERWVQAQEARALSCPYHQIVFTLPHELQPLWFYNRARFTNLFFQAAWQTLREFWRDPHWLGAEPGALASFQTWGEMQQTHVHLHVLMTAGGLTAEGRWKPAASSFFFPSRAVAKGFRGRLCAGLTRALRAGELCLPPPTNERDWQREINRFAHKRWHVQIQPPYSHPRGLILYLARYLRRGPIAESRISAYQNGQLTIRHKRTDPGHPQTFRLTAPEFIRRLLMHVPPKGLRVVRAYGLFHHRRAAQLAQARAQLPPPAATRFSPRTPAAQSAFADENALRIGVRRCPRCHALLTVTLRYYPSRAGPERIAA